MAVYYQESGAETEQLKNSLLTYGCEAVQSVSRRSLRGDSDHFSFCALVPSGVWLPRTQRLLRYDMSAELRTVEIRV